MSKVLRLQSDLLSPSAVVAGCGAGALALTPCGHGSSPSGREQKSRTDIVAQDRRTAE